MVIVFLSGTLNSTTPPRLMRCQWMVSLYIPFIMLCCYMINFCCCVTKNLTHIFLQLLTSSRLAPSLWTPGTFSRFFLPSPQVLQMCTELQSFAPRSLVFAFPECFEVIFLPKGGINEGTIGFWCLDLELLQVESCAASIHRPPVSQTLAWRQGLAARSQVRNMHLSRNEIWKLF